MAILVQVPAFDILPYVKVLLNKDVAAGNLTITLKSVAGFKANDIAILGVVNSVTAEYIEIDSVTAPNTIVLKAATKYAHSKDKEYLNFTLYNQFKLYSGSVPDNTQHIIVATVDMLAVFNTTTYVDTAGDESTYYSFSYFNSSNSVESQRYDLPIYGIPLDVTPDYIRNNFLYGLDLTDENANPLPDTLYWHGIKAAYHWLEQVLNIDIIARTYTAEEADFIQGEYRRFVFLQTKHYPVTEVTKIVGKYYGSNVNFPSDWIRLKKRMGIINLVPVEGTFTQFMYPQGGSILPILSGVDYVPNFWQITYKTGFATNELPYNLRDVIAKRACYMPLNILGDLVGGVAVASKSIGVDGLSQSLNTTSSAENAGYSARLRQYEREFKADIPMLKAYWNRMRLVAI